MLVTIALEGDEARAELVLIAHEGGLLTGSIGPQGTAADRVRSVVSLILEVSP